MLIVLNADRVGRAFQKLNLPFAFSDSEREGSVTMPVVSEASRVLGFQTPISNKGLNILNLRKLLGVDPLKPPSFFDHPWYLEESFGRVDCAPGWHFIEMEVEADSIEQPYNYCRSVEARGRMVPTAIEVVLMLFLHFFESGEHLLLKKHTWCSDEASLGRIVTVGAFGRNGVFVSSHPGTFASRGLGICGKIPNDALCR